MLGQIGAVIRQARHMPEASQSPYPRIFAIDPGLNGAWAVLGQEGEFVDTGELPRFANALNPRELSTLLRSHQPEAIIIELVGSRPEQGVSSTFLFGTAYGVCIGLAAGLGVPLSLISPAKWKSHFRLTGKSKDAARELATRLYPEAAPYLNLKRHCGRADALLMARYSLDREMGRHFV
jgi:crossover junction endodeoxyribonuclease RuvC